MLTIQNISPNFRGNFIGSDALKNRINNYLRAPEDFSRLYGALKQMDAVKDGKTYTYSEETIIEDKYLDEVESTYAYIKDEKGKKLSKMMLRSESTYSDGATFEGAEMTIGEFIDNFVHKHYPVNGSANDIKKDIFNLLV